jgi:hypothetical protein
MLIPVSTAGVGGGADLGGGARIEDEELERRL